MTSQEILNAWFSARKKEIGEWDTAIEFAREIQRLTREECAKVCDERADDCNHTWTVLVSKSCAKAIRAMKD